VRIRLINSPIRLNAPPNCIPSGLATIASTLRNAGHAVDILDLNALRPDDAETERLVREGKWDIIGLSGLVTTYGFQKKIAPIIREAHPRAFFISGGGLATSVPQLVMDKMPLDAAVIGEGEITALQLADALATGRGLETVAGLAWRDPKGSDAKEESRSYRDDGRGLTPCPHWNRPRKNIDDLDTVPFPAWDLLPMETYICNPVWGSRAANSSDFPPGVPNDRSMNVISSRGCPMDCNFCYHLFGRGKYRFRSPENIIAEIRLLVERYGIQFIGFIDDNFMASRQRALRFCELIRKEPYKIAWGCHGRVDAAGAVLLAEMREAGCVWIGYGIESGSQRILDAMNKKVAVEKAESAIVATRNAGIFANTTFIYGWPCEDAETVRETAEFKRRLGITAGSFFATPYPGTRLFEHARERIGDLEQFVLRLGNATDFVINLTDMSDEEFFALKEVHDGKSLMPQGR
jgi:radical SAM superfamily enzyme YgiQ (UPF0313 family)